MGKFIPSFLLNIWVFYRIVSIIEKGRVWIDMFEAIAFEFSLFVRFLSKIGMFFSRIRVNRITELGIGFLHIPVSAMDLDKIHDLMALFIIYVMKDELISITIGNQCMGIRFLVNITAK